MFPQENCGAANFTVSYDGVWGWADTRCSNNFIFICRVARGLLGPLAAAQPCSARLPDAAVHDTAAPC
jgi:hypothetical protein